MKPFRGKPEKPESPDGEIQRVSARMRVPFVQTDGRRRRAFARARVAAAAPHVAPPSDERVHFSSSRTSRPVVRVVGQGSQWSPCVAGVPHPVASRTCDVRTWPTPDGRMRGAGPRLARVRPAASAAGYSTIGLSADHGAGRLLAAVLPDRLCTRLSAAL